MNTSNFANFSASDRVSTLFWCLCGAIPKTCISTFENLCKGRRWRWWRRLEVLPTSTWDVFSSCQLQYTLEGRFPARSSPFWGTMFKSVIMTRNCMFASIFLMRRFTFNRIVFVGIWFAPLRYVHQAWWPCVFLPWKSPICNDLQRPSCKTITGSEA